MDIGAILLDPFDVDHLPQLHRALVESVRALDVDVDLADLHVAYSAHRDLGPRLVIHLTDHEDDAERDPVWFLGQFDEEEAELNGRLGAAVSGFLDDELGEDVPLSWAWTVLHARGGTFCVFKSSLHTAALSADTDVGHDDAPLRRMAASLEIGDVDFLRRKLERPDSRWVPIGAPPPAPLIADLRRAMGR